MTSEEKELISTIKIAVIRGIVFADEEKLLELIKTAVGSNMSEKPTGSTTKKDLVVDCISRKAALDITWHDPSYSDPLNVLTEVRDKIRELPSVTPQEPDQYKSFCEFVASEIFSENWEYNKDSFAEIACRKLAKLGIVRKNSDVWELVEPQKSEGEDGKID